MTEYMQKNKAYKIILFSVIIVELIAMLAVYPGGIIRRETVYGSGGNHSYTYTSPIGIGDECVQSFEALGDVLLRHSFAVKVEEQLSDDFVLLYELISETGEVLFSAQFDGKQLAQSGYRTVDVNLHLDKGSSYSCDFKVISGSGSVSLTCTPYPEDFTPGTISLSVNGVIIPGQAFNEFLYDQKLNFKNVLFTWLFLWIIGAAILYLAHPDEKSKEIPLLKIKWVQTLILATEILVSVIIFSRLTGGMGVDYDEAFSWNLVVCNDLKGILSATAADVHPPLYYLILKAAFSVFGTSLKVMVWASILPVIVGMILSSIYVRKNWGLGTAFLFNFVYGFAPFLLHYNLNLRMYSWMNLFVLGVILFAYEIRLESRNVYFILLFVFGILAVYTQYFAVLPIVVCYAWLFIYLVTRKDRKGIIRFLCVCVFDVLVYLPWLLYGMGNMGIGAEEISGEYEFFLKPSVIFGELFASNLENGDVMAMILLLCAILLFVVLRKRYLREEKSFIFMLLVNIVFCWYFSQWLGSLNGHFFHPRYDIFCLVFVWLIFSIVFSRYGKPVYILFGLWAIEICMSSFLVEKAYEYETTPLMPGTMAFFESNVEPDALIVYDYARSFDIIYRYYLPGHDFIAFEDLELDEMRGQTFWVINLGGASFSQEDIEEYGLTVEHNPGMGFMGMERFDLWKVTVEAH